MRKPLPIYLDGKFDLYEVKRTTESFSIKYLHKTGLTFWFHELAIYDKTRIQFQIQDKEITKKLIIPYITSIEGKECVIIIDGIQHEVYNSTTTHNNMGIAETELTCIKVQANYPIEVIP